MNIIFGKLQKTGEGIRREALSEYIGTSYGQDASFFEDGNLAFGFTEDQGAIFDQYRTDQISVYMLGRLQQPLPGCLQAEAVNSSAELLLERYLKLKEGFLDDVLGQFAVLLIDKANDRYFLGSDSLGIRTWFLRESDSSVIFSSNLYLLNLLSEEEFTLNRSREDFFLQYGFFPGQETVYANATALPPASLVSINSRGDITRRVNPLTPVWLDSLDNELSGNNSLDSLTEHLYNAFMQALRDQLPDEKRVAVLLGGFDSALVAAGLHALGKEVETFSFRYDESQFNQPNVEKLTDYLGIKHHWIKITEEIFASGLKTFPATFNQPTNWPNYVIQTAYLCENIRQQGIKYCFSGDGCDTIFLGYPGTYRRAVVLNWLPRIPDKLAARITSLFSYEFLDRALGHPYRVVLNILRSLGRDQVTRSFVSFKILDIISIRQLRKGKPPRQTESVEQVLQRLAAPHKSLSPLRLAYKGKSLVSPNRNKLVGSSDRHGVFIQSPYLHPGLGAFTAALPEEYLRPNDTKSSSVNGKYLLMHMARAKDLLPEEVIYQKKVAGVDGPIDDWYSGTLNRQALELTRWLPFEPDSKFLLRLSQPTWLERLFRQYVMVDKVITHAFSLVITYASFNRRQKAR